MKLDDLMQQPLVDTPNDFSQHLMHRIKALPSTQKSESSWLACLAVAGSGLIGLSQLIGFIFSLWTVTAAN
jgi:hypothetical protein